MGLLADYVMFKVQRNAALEDAQAFKDTMQPLLQNYRASRAAMQAPAQMGARIEQGMAPYQGPLAPQSAPQGLLSQETGSFGTPGLMGSGGQALMSGLLSSGNPQAVEMGQQYLQQLMQQEGAAQRTGMQITEQARQHDLEWPTRQGLLAAQTAGQEASTRRTEQQMTQAESLFPYQQAEAMYDAAGAREGFMSAPQARQEEAYKALMPMANQWAQSPEYREAAEHQPLVDAVRKLRSSGDPTQAVGVATLVGRMLSGGVMSDDEFNRNLSARGVAGRGRDLINRWLNGEQIPEETLDALLSTAETMAEGTMARAKERRAAEIRRATERFGDLTPEQISGQFLTPWQATAPARQVKVTASLPSDAPVDFEEGNPLTYPTVEELEAARRKRQQGRKLRRDGDG